MVIQDPVCFLLTFPDLTLCIIYCLKTLWFIEPLHSSVLSQLMGICFPDTLTCCICLILADQCAIKAQALFFPSATERTIHLLISIYYLKSPQRNCVPCCLFPFWNEYDLLIVILDEKTGGAFSVLKGK